MNLVRQSFNRAASSYDHAGTLQHQVAAVLTNFVTSALPQHFEKRLLDAGCGTGDCLKQLHTHYQNAAFVAVDFAERMLQQIEAHPRLLQISGDIQQLPIATGSMSAYLSSLAWQWCDPAIAACEASRVLEPEGDFFIATLVAGTFQELAYCLQACSLNPQQHLLHCVSSEEIQSAVRAAGLEIKQVSQTRMTTWHPDFRSLRHAIRGVGANHVPHQTPPTLTRKNRGHLIETYEHLRTPSGLPLSYEVLILHARQR